MSASLIRYSEDYSTYEVVLPDGTHLEKEPQPDDGWEFVVHPDDPAQIFLAVLSVYDEAEMQLNLKPNTLYRLSPIETETEDGCDFDAEDEEEEEGDPSPDGIV